MRTIRAVIRDGKIVPVEGIPFQDGASVLVTLAPEPDDASFWAGVDQDALAQVWDNEQDDVYAELLKK